jgi:transcriptional regulator GlxA family with amidase domain
LPARRDPGRGAPLLDAMFVLTPRSLLLDLAGPAEALRLANTHLQHAGRAPRFRLRYVASAERLESSVGVELARLEPLPDTLVAPTWLTLIGQPSAVLARPDDATLATARWLERRMTPCLDASPEHRLVTICSGTLLAARAGMLGTRRCTTHHTLLDRLRRLAPRATVVDNRVFVLDGSLASSAGVTAGIDLVLHLIASTCGEALAAAVAQDMVVYLRRTPADPELSPMLAHRHHLHPVVHRVQDTVSVRPTADWDAGALASVAGVSPRHLGRLFARHAGISPLHYVESLRLEVARQALRGGASVTLAAEAAGFHSDLQLRRAWRRHHGGSPRDATRAPSEVRR